MYNFIYLDKIFLWINSTKQLIVTVYANNFMEGLLAIKASKTY